MVKNTETGSGNFSQTPEENQWNKLLEERTGVPVKTWNKWNVDDFYLTAEQCLKFGIVEEII